MRLTGGFGLTASKKKIEGTGIAVICTILVLSLIECRGPAEQPRPPNVSLFSDPHSRTKGSGCLAGMLA